MKSSYKHLVVLFVVVSFVSLFESKVYGFLYPHETLVAEHLAPIEITEPNSNVPGIDCIYAINLDIRPDKWQRMKNLFDERNMKVNRVSGVYGKLIPKQTRIALQGPYYSYQDVSPGIMGCLLSHVSCIKDAYQRGFETIWIFEDDAEFLEDHHQIPLLLEKLSKIDPSWDIFYTDTDWRRPDGRYMKNRTISPRPDQPILPHAYYFHRHSIDHDIMRIGQRFGLHSYIVSRKGMEKILNYYTHSYVWISIDIDIHYIEGIRQYSPKRDIISNWQETPYSDAANSPMD